MVLLARKAAPSGGIRWSFTTSTRTTNRPQTRMLLLIVLLFLCANSSWCASDCDLQLDGTCATSTQPPTDSNDDNSHCGLYLAESAIPNSGLGMFTAKPIAPRERIFSGDIICNVEDIEDNMRLRNWFLKDFDSKPRDWMLYHYYWNPSNAMALYEANDVQSILPGLGMLANSHTGLVNAASRPPRRDLMLHLHRGRDPGAGASTNYHDVHFVATNGPIEAGAELFVEYGDTWFKDRKNDFGLIPISTSFKKADQLLLKFQDILDVQQAPVTSKLAQDVWDLLRDAASSDQRLLNAFPEQLQGLEEVQKLGGSTAKYSVPNRVRSFQWLQENGRCLDNIRPDASTLGQAGRGAFATRFILNGAVIAPLPLVQLRRHHMEVYDSEDMDDPDAEVWRIGTQLLMNYCYGHEDSSLLLFPYAPVVNYVNHNQTLANAKLVWSTHPNHHADWLLRTPEELDNEDHSGLMMELIATRDIQPGEEIFLDYGNDWEQAWSEYMQDWSPDEDDKAYVSAAQLDAQLPVLRTKQEFSTNPYKGSSIITACFVDELHKKNVTELVDKTSAPYEWKYVPELYDSGQYLERCDIANRTEPVDDDISSIRYTVYVRKSDKKGMMLVDNVPREAIRLFDMDYTSDLFLRSAFRHEIRIPDDMVPEAWRDLEQEEEDEE